LILFEIGSESERSQVAYVTFKDSQGAETAALLSVCSYCGSLSHIYIERERVGLWCYALARITPVLSIVSSFSKSKLTIRTAQNEVS
jgi:hypothetical protein